MSLIKHLFLSYISILFSCLSIFVISKDNFKKIRLLIDTIKMTDDYLGVFIVSLEIISIVWFVSIAISFSIKAIYELILFNYHGLFYKEKQIHVTINEDNAIVDTYLETSNGKIIPIKIRRIKLPQPNNKEVNESGE